MAHTFVRNHRPFISSGYSLLQVYVQVQYIPHLEFGCAYAVAEAVYVQVYA